MSARSVARGALGIAVTVVAVAGGWPAVGAAPTVAILHGTYDHNRHQAEHDEVLAGLGWTASKYPLTEVDRLLADLERYDLVICNPLFNYGPDSRDLGRGAPRWRAFLERGGALILTDCNYPSCVDWLAALAPSCAAATEPCSTAEPARESTPPHPLHRLPQPSVGRNSWQHLSLPAGGWEIMTQCGDGHATAAMQPLGKGVVVVTSSWPLRAADLEDLWVNLQLRRLGLAATRFETTPQGLGDGEVTLGLRSLGETAGTVRLTYTLHAAQAPARQISAAADIGRGGEAVLQLICRATRADDGARARLGLEVAGQTLTVVEHTLALPPLLAVRLEQPAYRGIAPAAALPDAVLLGVTVTPDAEPLPELRLATRLCSAAGVELASLPEQAVSERESTLRLRLPTLAAGEYVVQTELRRGAAVAARVESALSILPDAPATVVIDGNLSLRVAGRPFFPLGMYHVDEAELPALAALGLNTVQGWGGDLERARRFLDRAQAHGLKVLLEMGGLVCPQVQTAAIVAHIDAFRDHPALLAWYVRDEPSPGQHAMVREATELFQRLDRRHPTYLVSCSPGDFAVQAQFADVFAVDPYPLPGGSIGMVAQWAEAARQATQDRRPVWLIPQLHDNTSYERQPPERGAKPPTPAQERCMVYQCLVHGARGIVWYTWDDAPNMGAKYHPALQDALRSLCQEVGALAPWLLGGTRRQFLAGGGNVHGLVCVAPAGRRLIVVSTATDAVSVEIEVEEALPEQAFRPLAGGPEVKAQGGRLPLHLEPLEVRVFSF